jgi:hypothetical protein
MAFAQKSAVSETSLGTAGTTINVQLPATIDSGALIEINLAYENANLGVPDPGTPTGYTLKKSITTNSGKDAATFLYMKVADGTEGGTTVAFTTSMNNVVAAQARAWTAWDGTLTNVIVSTGINVVSASPNPDSVTTGGAAADNVFVVGLGIYVNLGTVSAYSSGYTGGTLTQAGDTTDGAGMATCYLESAAASDDPGAFSLSETERCHAFTYVIPPSAGTTHNCLADDIETDPPELGNPAVGQTHVCQADDVVTGAPSLTEPAVGQTHIVLADDLETQPPELDEATVGQTHVILVDDLVTGPPELSEPAAGQIHALEADDVVTDPPELGQPAVGQTHVCLADDVICGPPFLSQPGVDGTGPGQGNGAQGPIVRPGRLLNR